MSDILKIKDPNTGEWIAIPALKTPTDQTYNPESENAQSGKAIAPVFANALKGNKSGAVVCVDDISLVPHKLDVRLSGGKNLFDKSAEWEVFDTMGTGYYHIQVPIYVGVGTTVTVSLSKAYTKEEIEGKMGDVTNKPVVIYAQSTIQHTAAIDNNYYLIEYASSENNKQSVTLTGGDDGYITLYISAIDTATRELDYTVYNAFVNEIQVELGEVATDYAAYGDFSGISVKKYGKNLFDMSTPNSDFVSIGSGYRALSIYVGMGTTVTVSLLKKHETGSGLGYFYTTDGKDGTGQGYWLYHNSVDALCNKSATFKSTDGYISLAFTGDIESFQKLSKEIQVEIGSVATDYEEYKNAITVTANTDGTANIDYEYPTITLIPDNDYVTIDMTYNRDINKAFAKLEQLILNNA